MDKAELEKRLKQITELIDRHAQDIEELGWVKLGLEKKLKETG